MYIRGFLVSFCYFLIFGVCKAEDIDSFRSLSTLRLCGDQNCSDTISLGIFNHDSVSYSLDKGLIYHSKDVIHVKSKSAGTDLSLWSGLDSNGIFGYFPFVHVDETQILISEPSYLTTTQDGDPRINAIVDDSVLYRIIFLDGYANINELEDYSELKEVLAREDYLKWLNIKGRSLSQRFDCEWNYTLGRQTLRADFFSLISNLTEAYRRCPVRKTLVVSFESDSDFNSVESADGIVVNSLKDDVSAYSPPAQIAVPKRITDTNDQAEAAVLTAVKIDKGKNFNEKASMSQGSGHKTDERAEDDVDGSMLDNLDTKKVTDDTESIEVELKNHAGKVSDTTFHIPTENDDEADFNQTLVTGQNDSRDTVLNFNAIADALLDDSGSKSEDELKNNADEILDGIIDTPAGNDKLDVNQTFDTPPNATEDTVPESNVTVDETSLTNEATSEAETSTASHFARDKNKNADSEATNMTSSVDEIGAGEPVQGLNDVIKNSEGTNNFSIAAAEHNTSDTDSIKNDAPVTSEHTVSEQIDADLAENDKPELLVETLNKPNKDDVPSTSEHVASEQTSADLAENDKPELFVENSNGLAPGVKKQAKNEAVSPNAAGDTAINEERSEDLSKKSAVVSEGKSDKDLSALNLDQEDAVDGYVSENDEGEKVEDIKSTFSKLHKTENKDSDQVVPQSEAAASATQETIKDIPESVPTPATSHRFKGVSDIIIKSSPPIVENKMQEENFVSASEDEESSHVQFQDTSFSTMSVPEASFTSSSQSPLHQRRGRRSPSTLVYRGRTHTVGENSDFHFGSSSLPATQAPSTMISPTQSFSVQTHTASQATTQSVAVVEQPALSQTISSSSFEPVRRASPTKPGSPADEITADSAGQSSSVYSTQTNSIIEHSPTSSHGQFTAEIPGATRPSVVMSSYLPQESSSVVTETVLTSHSDQSLTHTETLTKPTLEFTMRPDLPTESVPTNTQLPVGQQSERAATDADISEADLEIGDEGNPIHGDGKEWSEARLRSLQTHRDSQKVSVPTWKSFFSTWFLIRSPYVESVLSSLISGHDADFEKFAQLDSDYLAVGLSTVIVSFCLVIFVVAFFCYNIQKNRRSTVDQLSARIIELDNHFALLKPDMVELQSSAAETYAQVSELRKQFAYTQQQSNQIGATLAKIRLHNDQLEKDIVGKENDLSSFTQQIQLQESTNKSQLAHIEQQKEQYEKLNEETSSLTEQLQSAEHESAWNRQQWTELEQLLRTLSEQSADLQLSRNQFAEEVDGWKQRSLEIDAEITSINQHREQLEVHSKEQTAQIEVLKESFSKLNASVKQSGPEKGVTDSSDNLETSNDDVSHVCDEDEIHKLINTMSEVSRLRALMGSVQTERDSMQEKLHTEMALKNDLEEQIRRGNFELEKLEVVKDSAEKRGDEAATKLQILSDYFKTRESELQLQLGEREILLTDDTKRNRAVDEKQKGLNEEMENVRLKCNDLRSEIDRLETEHRAQLTLREKKAHENWLAARQAEHDLRSVKADAAELRERLVQLHRIKESMDPNEAADAASDPVQADRVSNPDDAQSHTSSEVRRASSFADQNAPFPLFPPPHQLPPGIPSIPPPSFMFAPPPHFPPPHGIPPLPPDVPYHRSPIFQRFPSPVVNPNAQHHFPANANSSVRPVMKKYPLGAFPSAGSFQPVPVDSSSFVEPAEHNIHHGDSFASLPPRLSDGGPANNSKQIMSVPQSHTAAGNGSFNSGLDPNQQSFSNYYKEAFDQFPPVDHNMGPSVHAASHQNMPAGHHNKPEPMHNTGVFGREVYNRQNANPDAGDYPPQPAQQMNISSKQASYQPMPPPSQRNSSPMPPPMDSQTMQSQHPGQLIDSSTQPPAAPHPGKNQNAQIQSSRISFI